MKLLQKRLIERAALTKIGASSNVELSFVDSGVLPPGELEIETQAGNHIVRCWVEVTENDVEAERAALAKELFADYPGLLERLVWLQDDAPDALSEMANEGQEVCRQRAAQPVLQANATFQEKPITTNFASLGDGELLAWRGNAGADAEAARRFYDEAIDERKELSDLHDAADKVVDWIEKETPNCAADPYMRLRAQVR